MSRPPRPFRTDESLASEAARRGAIKPLLEARGFSRVIDQRVERGTSTSQVISGLTPEGEAFKARVRLCWRRDGRNARERDYSAAQLRARLIDNSWTTTLEQIVTRESEQYNSHNLFVQDDGPDFVFAALAPSVALGEIWRAQRARSDRLIAAGLTGAIAKNHAANGSSPTIYLQDDRTAHTHAVADVFWAWPGVINVLAYPARDGAADSLDTFDDLPLGLPDLGRDLGERIAQVRSGFARDQKVRRAVLARSEGACERPGCWEHRAYRGFLDVHHILGIWASDRVWSCVALCPNCHREAHVSPQRDQLNAELEAYALRYKDDDGALTRDVIEVAQRFDLRS